MRRADRLFELVQYLRNKRVMTARELAEKMEVSERTIYRDIRDLQSTGVPIEGEAGVGYSLSHRYELPPLTFNTDELEALVLGARFVSTWGDPSLAAASRRILSKIEMVLPEVCKGVMSSTQLFANPIAKPPPDYLEMIRRAISEKQRLCFAYTRKDGTGSSRIVCPLGLFFWGSVWLLASWCELREDFRNFRVDRMQYVETVGVFEENDVISLESFLLKMKAKKKS